MPKEEEKPKREVEILSRRQIVTYPRIKEPKEQTVVTFVAHPLPPQTIFMDTATWTKEKEAKLIRKTIEQKEVEKPETIEV